MKLSFSLPKSNKPVGAAPPLKKPVAFGSLEDDEPIDGAPVTSSDTKGNKANKQRDLVAETSRAMQKRMEAEMKVDSTVYDYDDVWDKMQEAKQKQKQAKEMAAGERKPKYIAGLLNSAATRKLDHLRAEEKMIQREREMEGDEFADKEAFVTQAYKDQQAEVRRAEAEEKAREEAEKKKRGTPSTGMAHFYRKLLEDSEQQHAETVQATTSSAVKGPQGPSVNLTITKPPDLAPKSDVELAQIAREQGKDVELNDDNQIVDKRDLLSAGLNLSAPNTRKLGLTISKNKSGQDNEVVQTHRAVGTAASRKEINERRAREIRQQMAQEEERVREEKDREEHERTQRIVVKRNQDDAIQSAKERYLLRKKRKLEEAVTATDGETAEPSPS